MTSEITRATLLNRGVRTATAFAIGGTALGTLAGSAQAQTPSDNDLAYLRMVIASELLAIDFYTKAIALRRFPPAADSRLREALENEQSHYRTLAAAMVDAGQVPAVAGDINFLYPRGGFASRTSIARLGTRLEAMFVGSTLGAAEGIESDALRLQVAQIAASEARHLAMFSVLEGRGVIGPAFPPALSIDQATTALSLFES